MLAGEGGQGKFAIAEGFSAEEGSAWVQRLPLEYAKWKGD